MLEQVEGYDDFVVVLQEDKPKGEIIEIDGLYIRLPALPKKENILFHSLPKKEQKWSRLDFPSELLSIKSMDEWLSKPKPFRDKYTPYIEREFNRRREGVWFYNNGVPTYITGHHYMLLQWSQMDIGYAYYFAFQRDIFIHMQACIVDPRCFGQNYVKCRRSGYTNCVSSTLVDSGTITAKALIGIQSKTGKDAQENIFMKKVVPMYQSYPFFFKPIQDGSTNPRMELAFRSPSEKITKNNKVSYSVEGLSTVINWKNTVANAYDGEKTFRLYLDEAGKWEAPADINEAWRIERTCLLVGRKVIGKAFVGSTVNPMEKGGSQYKKLTYESFVSERNENGRTKSGLYNLFIPAYKALEGFFDVYGNCIEDDPDSPVMGIDGIPITIGSKTFLKREMKALEDNPSDLNEYVRQFPWSLEEAFRDSVDGSHFNVGRIYQQIDHNQSLHPNPVVRGNFIWKVKDEEVVFDPNPNGRFLLAWMPKPEDRNKFFVHHNGRKSPGNSHIGVGGVDSYDIDETTGGRGSNGALHLFNKSNPYSDASNMFVLEYAARPDLAATFYEDVLMAAFFFGYPLLIENNKYGIARHFENRGFDNYLLDRPKHLLPKKGSVSSKVKGVPSTDEVIRAHAEAIEAYIHVSVGYNLKNDTYGNMYFSRTLEDWIGYKMSSRTKYDLTVSSGLALLAAQAPTIRISEPTYTMDQVIRKHKVRSYHV